MQIAGTLQGVVTQSLLPTADGRGRVAALEILFPDDACRNLIRQGKVEQIYSVMQTEHGRGMQTLEQALSELVQRRVITKEARARRVEPARAARRPVRARRLRRSDSRSATRPFCASPEGRCCERRRAEGTDLEEGDLVRPQAERTIPRPSGGERARSTPSSSEIKAAAIAAVTPDPPKPEPVRRPLKPLPPEPEEMPDAEARAARTPHLPVRARREAARRAECRSGSASSASRRLPKAREGAEAEGAEGREAQGAREAPKPKQSAQPTRARGEAVLEEGVLVLAAPAQPKSRRRKTEKPREGRAGRRDAVLEDGARRRHRARRARRSAKKTKAKKREEPSDKPGREGLKLKMPRLERPARAKRGTSGAEAPRRSEDRRVAARRRACRRTTAPRSCCRSRARSSTPGIIVGGELREPELLADALREFFRSNNLPKRNVRLGIANNRIGVRSFEIVGIDDPAQLDNAIRFRAQEALPIPIEEAVLDYQILGESDERGRRDGQARPARRRLPRARRPLCQRVPESRRRARRHRPRSVRAAPRHGRAARGRTARRRGAGRRLGRSRTFDVRCVRRSRLRIHACPRVGR